MRVVRPFRMQMTSSQDHRASVPGLEQITMSGIVAICKEDPCVVTAPVVEDVTPMDRQNGAHSLPEGRPILERVRFGPAQNKQEVHQFAASVTTNNSRC